MFGNSLAKKKLNAKYNRSIEFLSDFFSELGAAFEAGVGNHFSLLIMIVIIPPFLVSFDSCALP